MNQEQNVLQLNEFILQSESDGRNFPLKVESNVILSDDRHEIHQPHNGVGYLLHCGWASRKLVAAWPKHHADFGSYLYFAAIASAITVNFRYHDIRPYPMELPGLTSVAIDLMKIPYGDGTIESVSCLHVLEHVGLGRYGDVVDSMGDVKAARELARILASDGHLIFVVPVNKQSGVVFNAHRQYRYEEVQEVLFPKLRLLEFSLITARGEFVENADPLQIVDNSGNVEDTGCFWFKKP